MESSYCVIPENIHTLPTEDYWKIQGGGGSKDQKYLKGTYEPKLESPKGGGVQTQKPSVGEGEYV